LSRPTRSLSVLWAPLLFSAIFAAQCLWFVGTQSLTYDEPTHVIAGLDAWRHHRFDQWNDQPPLARLLLTMPLLADGDEWRLTPQRTPLGANYWTVNVRPSPERLAWRTRPVNIVLGVLLLWLIWTTARRLWSDGAAHLATALFALSPPLIAHFSMATVDGTVTLLFFATAVTLLRWRGRPSWRMTIALGVVVGGFLLAKFSAPPLVVLMLAIMLLTPSAGDLLSRLTRVAAVLVVAVAVIWLGYFLRVGPVRFRSGSFYDRAAPGVVIVPVARRIDRSLRLPAPEYLPALSIVTQHGLKGHPAFFLGEINRSGGWRTYFPIVVALKWPLTIWAFALTSLVLVSRAGWPPELAFLMLFPVAFFALAMVSSLNIGDRYVLPVYPFLILLCAGVWPTLQARRSAMVIASVVLALQTADISRYAPDYLSYFNVFVRPDRSYELLTDSNLDWGQGLLALREYAANHPAERLHLAYFGGVDPRDYGLRADALGENQRASGTVVVSATHLSGQYLKNRDAYHWLFRFSRVAILNHSLHVFQVPGRDGSIDQSR